MTEDPRAGAAIVILAGPPCSGKSTYAAAHARPGVDQVLDWDVLFAEISGFPLHVQPFVFNRDVTREFDRRASRLRRGFIIRSAPSPTERAQLRARHQAKSIVLAVWPYECVRRLLRSDRPAEAKAQQERYVHRWWDLYNLGRCGILELSRIRPELGLVRGRVGPVRTTTWR